MNGLIHKIILTAALSTAAVSVCARTVYTAGRLKNGLAYHILTVPSAGRYIDVQMQVGAGAADENGIEEIGTAHMVEHMVFRSAPDFPDGVGNALVAAGWRRGAEFNALTGHERTLYLFRSDKGRAGLEQALRALSAMMSPHVFSAEDWRQEKQIIEAEWRNGLGAAGRMNRWRTEVLRSGSRQARFAVIGTLESIRNTPPQVLEAFHRRWYVPENMRLVVSGRISPDEAVPLLEKYFGGLRQGGLPERGGSYYEPVLRQGWHIAESREGGSFISVLFRFDDSPSRSDDDDGERERNIDRIALHILTQRADKRQQGRPETGDRITVRKASIGRHTSAVGFATAVAAPGGHRAGLAAILELRERILRKPVTPLEFETGAAAVRDEAARAKRETGLPDGFEQAVQTVTEAVFTGKPVRTPAQKAEAAEAALRRIGPEDISRRLRQWLEADDKLVQVQSPGSDGVKDFPRPSEIAALAEKLRAAELPELPTDTADGGFTMRPEGGAIVAEQHERRLKITRWTLQNGDTVVVQNHPAADGKTYIRILGETGFMGAGSHPRLVRTAQKTVWQSAPQGFTPVQLSSWMQRHRITLNMTLQADGSKIAGSAPDEETESLLHLYHAYAVSPQVGAAESTLSQRVRVEEAADGAAKERAAEEIRFGRIGEPVPVGAEAVGKPQFLAQWRNIIQAPAAVYILTGQSAARLKPLVGQYLAGIPRRPSENAAPRLPLSGSKMERRAIHSEARSDVSAWTFASRRWNPQTAVQIKLLRILAGERLKTELRDKAAGIYSLKFEAVLNPARNRVESELHFTAAPDKAAILLRLGEETLAALPDTLTEQQLAPLRRRFIEQETGRLKNPEAQLERLIERERYPADADSLAGILTLEKLREAAKLLWPSENRRVLIADPKE